MFKLAKTKHCVRNCGKNQVQYKIETEASVKDLIFEEHRLGSLENIDNSHRKSGIAVFQQFLLFVRKQNCIKKYHKIITVKINK